MLILYPITTSPFFPKPAWITKLKLTLVIIIIVEKVCIDVKSDFDWLVFSEDIDRERQTLRLVYQLSYWKALIYHLHLVQCTICNKAACDNILLARVKVLDSTWKVQADAVLGMKLIYCRDDGTFCGPKTAIQSRHLHPAQNETCQMPFYPSTLAYIAFCLLVVPSFPMPCTIYFW